MMGPRCPACSGPTSRRLSLRQKLGLLLPLDFSARSRVSCLQCGRRFQVRRRLGDAVRVPIFCGAAALLVAGHLWAVLGAAVAWCFLCLAVATGRKDAEAAPAWLPAAAAFAAGALAAFAVWRGRVPGVPNFFGPGKGNLLFGALVLGLALAAVAAVLDQSFRRPLVARK